MERIHIEPAWRAAFDQGAERGFNALVRRFLGEEWDRGEATVRLRTLTLPGGAAVPVFFKRYKYSPPSLGFLGRPSKARCEFANYEILEALGLRVARRVAWGEQRDRWGRLKAAFIVTQAIPHAETLAVAAREKRFDYVTRRRLIEEMAAMTRAMHDRHFFYHDLVWRNVLVAPDDLGTLRLWLIDCPRGGISSWRFQRRRHQLRDLASLDKLASLHCSRSERLHFLTRYLGAGSVTPQVRELARAVVTYRRGRWPEDWRGK